MKNEYYYESNKQIDLVCVFEDQFEPLPNFKEELLAPREALLRAGKMSVKERKVKNACG